MKRIFQVSSVRGIGTGFNLLLIWLVARSVDLQDAGVVIFVWTTVNLAASICKLGQDLPLLRAFVTASESENTRPAVQVLHVYRRRSSVVGIGIGIAIAGAIRLWVGQEFGPLAIVLTLSAVPVIAMTLLHVEVIKATGSIELAGFFQTGGPAVLGSLAVAVASPGSVSTLIVAVVFGIMLNAAFATAVVLAKFGRPIIRIPDAWSADAARPELSEGVPVWLADLARVITIWSPMAALAIAGVGLELTLYVAAQRVSNLSNVGVAGFQNVVGPQIASALDENDGDKVVQLENKILLWTVPVALLAFGAAYVFGPIILGLLGDGVEDGQLHLAVLSAAHMFRVAGVVPGLALGLSRERERLVWPAVSAAIAAVGSSAVLSILWPQLIAVAFLIGVAVLLALNVSQMKAEDLT